MDTLIDTHLDNLRTGPVQRFERMAVVPLFGPGGGPMYLTLPEACADHLLTVTEVSDQGAVPRLRAENRADLPILLLDGEELIGAKQNRVVNATILLPAQSVTAIPVSCTEQGRWDYTSPEFNDSGVVLSHSLRAHQSRDIAQSLAARGDYTGDQGRLWTEIDDLHERSGTDSPTRAMRDAFEARRTPIESYVGAFEPKEGQTGLIVFIDGRIVGLDNLSWDLSFKRLASKLLRSYALEAVVGEPARGLKPNQKAAQAFIRKARATASQKYDSVGLGEDFRFTGGGLVGTALAFNDHVIHTAFFPADDAHMETDNGRMMSSRWRRRNDLPPLG